MKRILGLAAVAMLVVMAYSKMMAPTKAPVARLIKNAQASIKANPKDGDSLFLLARLYSLQYASASDQVAVYDPDHKPHLPPWDTVRVTPDKGAKDRSRPLWLSITTYRQAIQVDPKNPVATLGYAWMQEEAAHWIAQAPAGDPKLQPIRSQTESQWRKGAITAYRMAFELAKDGDLGAEHAWRFPDAQVSGEAAENLLRLHRAGLVSLSNSDVSRYEDQIKKLKEKPVVISPIIFPVAPNTKFSELTDTSAQVKFALDGRTPKTWSWIKPNAAFLCWDPNGTGKVESGRDLFGNVTFWMFFRNGYDALASLDDNHDGILTGRELRFIRVWRDANSNGISDPGEVRSLASYGIVGIRCRAGGRNGAIWHNTAGLVLADGSVKPTYDWLGTEQTRTADPR